MTKQGDGAGAPDTAADAAEPEPRGLDPLGLDEAPDSAQEPVAAARTAGAGRGLAGFALLLALAALAGAGFLYYQLIHRSDDPLADRLDAMDRALEDRLAGLEQRLDTRLAGVDERQQAALEAFAERQQASQRAAAAALETALAEVAEWAPPSRGEWQEAEVGYLLRIANHRLLLERDVAGALRLLRAADSILTELDDFALHPVRARLADEIVALDAVRELDLQGLFLRLEAAKRGLADLPSQLPSYRPPAASAPASATASVPASATASVPASATASQSGFLGELQRHFAGLLRVRRLESDAKPLLTPEESLYLELNLRLMLERAQLAAMNREQPLFEKSLADAADWVRRYFQTDDPAVRRLLDELTALQGLELAQPLPDIAGSLNALEQVQRPPPLETP